MVQLTGLWTSFTSTAAAVAATSTPPSVDTFARWSNAAQVAYVSANSTDEPPFLVIGDPSGPQVLATLSLDRQSVITTAVPSSYSKALSTGALPTSDDFSTWDPELQLAYLRAQGIDAASTLVLGDKAGAQLTVTLNWNGSGVVATPVPQSYGADLATGAATAIDFQRWPPVLQLAYLKAKGSGNPPSLIVGDPTDTQILATPSADGKGVLTSMVPRSYSAAAATGAAPAGGDAAGWGVQLRFSYLTTISKDTPPYLIIGDPSGTQTLATLSSDGKGLVEQAVPNSYSTAVATGVPPAANDAGTWAAQLQLEYLRSGSRDVPPFLITSDAAGRLSLATLGAGGGSVTSNRVPPDYQDAMSNGGSPPADDFVPSPGTWPEALQLTYLRTKGIGSPPFAVIDPASPDGVLATLGAGGRSVVTTALPQSYGAAWTGAAAPTLGVFQGWAPQLQLSYLLRNGSGTPKTLTFGSGQQAYTASVTASGASVSIVKGDTGSPSYWGTETAAPSVAAILARAQTLTADVYATWPLASQVGYLQANGTGAPPALLLPLSRGGSQLVSLAPGSNIVQITTVQPDFTANLTARPSTDAPTLAQFNGWTTAAQTSYLAGRGDAVELGTFDAWSAADQAAYLATVPDTATVAEFQSWPTQLQTYYLATKGSGSPPSLVLPEKFGGVVATLSSDGMTVAFTATGTKTLSDADDIAVPPRSSGGTPYPSTLYPSIFFNLTPDEQQTYYQNFIKAKAAAYVQNNPASVIPPTGPAAFDVLNLYGPSSDSTIVQIAVAGQTIKVAIPTGPWSNVGLDSVQADYSAFAPGTASSRTFGSWPAQVQAAYVLQRAATAFPGVAASTYPKVAVLSDKTVAIVPSAGASASVVPDASSATVGFSAAESGTTPDPSSFLQWPYACQLAWLLQQPSSPVTLGTNPNDVQLALNADGSGFQVAMATDLAALLGQTGAIQALTASQRATALQALDFSLYGKVASPLLQAKLLATLAQPGSSPPIVTVTPAVGLLGGTAVVISGGTAATGQGFTIDPLPSNYATDPGALTPDVFMAWTPAVRESYVLAHVSAAALPGTLDASGNTIPAFTIGSGIQALSVTFSRTDGTLQVVIPQTLADIATSGTGRSTSTTALAGTLLPYNYLPGSAVGTTSAINDAVSAALFPVLDGSGGTHNVAMSAQQQRDFAKPPAQLAGSTFAGWPSALQLQYLRAWQQPGTPLTVGTGSDTLDALMQTTALAGAVPRVYIVQNLQKADIGQMSYADQATLAKSTAFTAIANGLGLIPDDGTTAALGGNDVPDPNAGLTTAAAGTSKLSAFGFVQTMFVTALNTIDYPTQVAARALPNGNMPAADRKVFEDEVNLLRRQTFGSPLPTSRQNQSGGQAIFSPKDIQDKLTAIVQRFTRANAFSTAANGTGAGYFVIDSIAGLEDGQTALSVFANRTADNGYGMGSFTGYWVGGDRTDMSLDFFMKQIMGSNPPTSGTPVTYPSNIVLTRNDNANHTLTVTSATIQLEKTVRRGDSGYDGYAANSVNGSEYAVATSDNPPAYNVYQLVAVTGNEINQGSTKATTDYFGDYAQDGNGADGFLNLANLSYGLNYWFNNDNGASILSQLKSSGRLDASTLADGKVHTITGDNLATGTHDTSNIRLKGVTVHWVPTAASTDGNKTVDSGYNTFMAQEKAVLDLANRAEQLATSGRIGGTRQNLDAPNLVYLFMMYANLTGEAVLRADTEEVNQTNAVLAEYAVMQKIINQTVAHIQPGDDGKPGKGALWGSNPDGSFTDQDNAALAMFLHGVPFGSGKSGDPPLSPIELLQTGFTRPYLTNGKGDSSVASSQWSADGTKLSDAVTQLNQASQLKMNDINSETKQKDRQFDLANTALQKMNEIVNKIAASM